jgi:F-type H+-transporting ATPase subunit a
MEHTGGCLKSFLLGRKARFIILVVFFFVFPLTDFASDEAEEAHEFNTADYLFEHVNDSHEWFFFSNHKNHFSIPLLVILYSQHTGWHFLSSAAFYHDNSNPENLFYLAKGGPRDGKIVERLGNGNESVPIDFSLTKTVFGALIVSIMLIIVILSVARKTVQDPLRPPKKLQNLIEPVVIFVRDEIAKPFAGDEYKRFLPYLLTLFFFILIANLLGLILPLGFNITGNIAVTAALGLFTFVITLINGNRKYWLHIVNPDVPVFMKLPVPLMPIIELAGVIIKPMILTIRLFANMFAGHVIIVVLLSLIFIMSALAGVIAGSVTAVVSVLFSLFILLLDLLVSFIQAYIFTLLSAMYFGMATEKGHH